MSMIYWLQFMRMALSHQPCERLLGNPRRQLIHEGPVTLIRKSFNYGVQYGPALVIGLRGISRLDGER